MQSNNWRVSGGRNMKTLQIRLACAFWRVYQMKLKRENREKWRQKEGSEERRRSRRRVNRSSPKLTLGIKLKRNKWEGARAGGAIESEGILSWLPVAASALVVSSTSCPLPSNGELHCKKETIMDLGSWVKESGTNGFFLFWITMWQCTQERSASWS